MDSGLEQLNSHVVGASPGSFDGFNPSDIEDFYIKKERDRTEKKYDPVINAVKIILELIKKIQISSLTVF